MKANYKILFNLIYLIITTLNSSCKSDLIERSIIINPEKAIEKDVLLSDFAKEITYIPLDNEIAIKQPNRIVITNDRIFISASPIGILAYDQNGNLLNNIGTRGRGPGEYLTGIYFATDQENELMYIYSSKKILIYSFDGDFKRDFEINEPEYVGDIYFLNGRLYHAGGPRFDYDWVVYDTIGNIVSYKLNKIPSFVSGWGSYMGFATDNQGLYYWNSYNDTIFYIQDDHYQPKMFFARGEFRLPYKDYPREDYGIHFNPVSLINTHKYLFITYLMDQLTHVSYINKEDGRLFIIDRGADMSLFNRPGILNDLDAGPIFPPFYYHYENNEEFLVGWIYSHRLKTHVNSDTFKSSTPKYPEKKKELEELAASLDENDNPVLMLVKLKE